MDNQKNTLKNDSVVISGISGTYPQCKSIKDLDNILYNKINPISKADNVWKRTVPEISEYVGQVPEWDRFDAQFCKIHNHLAKCIDPMTRKLLEHSYQALYDAGVNPCMLKSRKIGVYVGVGIAESERNLYTKVKNGFGLQGTLKALNANRVSYFLGLVGPSMTYDQMCSSSIVAMEQAFQAMVRGDIDGALVGGSNLCTMAQVAILYERAVGLSKNNKSKSFDQNADGYVRSDGINFIFLQKAKDANRVYAELCHVKTEIVSNELSSYYAKCDPEKIIKFLNDFYESVNVDPKDVEYVEAFGCAKKYIDKMELDIIDEVFNKNRKEALAVGSIISNIGCTGPASGLTSIIKILIGYHRGMLAGNLHCENLRKDVRALLEKRIQILRNHKTFRRNSYMAVNNMSITGCFGHVLLKEHYKPKDIKYVSNIPYLVVISGRQEVSVTNVIDDLKSRHIDPEEIALLHNIHTKGISGHLARGYVILDKINENNCTSTEMLARRVSTYDDVTKQLWFVYSGMGSQWPGMGRDLLLMPIFAATINRCQKVLNPTGIDLIDIITSREKSENVTIIHSFVAIAAMQIALTDILRAIGIVPDKIIGHSLGELGCAYADGSMTLEEVMLVAHMRGKLSAEGNFIRGSMAAVGLGFKEVSKLVPPEIDVACHNGPNSSTISGPENIVKDFVKKLDTENYFVKEVNTHNIAYHSRYVAKAGPQYLAELKKIIRHPKRRSDKWISTSVPQEQWNEEFALYSSAEYHSLNLLNPVLFEEAMRFIPNNAVVLEIAPHGLLQAVLRRSLSPDCTVLSLVQRYKENNVRFLLESLGKLYSKGYNVNLQALYPKVEFPVSSDTNYLSHLVHWYHEDIYVTSDRYEKCNKSSCCNYKISVHDDEYSYLRGYEIEGRNMYPFAAALVAIWDTFAMIRGVPKKKLSVQFIDVQFFSQPLLHNQRLLRLTVSISRSSGHFEVTSEDNKVTTGIIYGNRVSSQSNTTFISHANDSKYDYDGFNSNDIYEKFKHRGYSYSKDFKIINQTNKEFTQAEIIWNENWVILIEGMLQLNVLKRNNSGVSLPLFIRELCINVKEHNHIIARSNIQLHLCINDIYGYTKCGGIVMIDIKLRDYPKPCIEKTINDFTKIRKEKEEKHYLLQCAKVSDFNSMYWQEYSPKTTTKDEVLVNIHYASINMQDVKIINGYLPFDPNNKAFGMDFSGTTQSGERIMGIVPNGSLCTQLSVNPNLLWPIPKHWSLEDAATIPLAYVQAFYFLVIKGEMRRDMTIFVHGGSGALGQAVLSIALAFNCKVFTTVSDVYKKQFLMKLYPELKEQNIGYSRNDNFADMIMSITKGKGCDVVIENISRSRKKALMNCCVRKLIIPVQNLKEGNYTLELFDLFKVEDYIFADISSIFNEDYANDLKTIRDYMAEGISSGWVRPLSRMMFASVEAPRAFRLLAESKHRGRVLLKLDGDNFVSSIPTSIRTQIGGNSHDDKIRLNTEFKTLADIISYIDFNDMRGSLDLIVLPTLISNEKIDEEFNSNETYVCIIPGVEGHFGRFKDLSERIKLPAVVLQPELGNLDVKEQAHLLLKVLQNKVGIKKEFYLLGYEYGVFIAFELAAILENKGFKGTIFCVGDPVTIKNLFKGYVNQFYTEEALQEDIILHMCSLLASDAKARVKNALQSCGSWKQRVDTTIQVLRKHLTLPVQYMTEEIESVYARVTEASQFDTETLGPLKSKIIFLQTKSKFLGEFELQRYSQKATTSCKLDIPLSQITKDLRCASIINRYLSKDILEQFESKNICESYTTDKSFLNTINL